MNSGASRILGLLAVGLFIPACNLTVTTSDPNGFPPPQNPFSLQIPITNQTGVWPTNTQFAWGEYVGATSYKFELSRMPDFSQILYTKDNIGVTSIFLTVSLAHGTTYYWRVSTVVSAVTIYAGGSGSSFTTIVPVFGPPVGFFLQSPLGTPAGPVPAPVFLWSYAQEATSYSLEIDTSSLFTNPIVSLTDLRITRAECPVTLASNTTYFWRVTAFNSAGPTASSPAYSTFTTVP
jgi:hypothetical protein